MALQIGTQIGPYQLTDQIGSGGMATVYKARQARLNRFVAVKVMHEMFANDPDFLARFEREAQIVAQLDHPNIVPIYDYDEHDNRPYLVTKLIDGLTLKRVMMTQVLTPQDIIALLNPVAKALTYAHEQGILHRDIKPSNIMIDRNGFPYLTDFGLARILQAGSSTISTDTMLGTPHYISPEQASGQTDLTAATDVYSFGVILYEMVVGRAPFWAESAHAIIHDHIYSAPPDPRELKPDISEAVEAVLLKALEKDPADRYQSATELIEAYRAAVGETAPAEVAPATERRKPAFTPGEPPADASMVQPVADSKKSREQRAAERYEKLKKRRARIAVTVEDDDDNEVFNAEVGGDNKKNAEEKFEEEIAQLTPEERMTRRAERIVRQRREAFGGLVTNFLVFLFINTWLFDFDEYVIDLVNNGWSGLPFFITTLWIIGLTVQAIRYYSEHGPGRRAREREIERELERERRRVYGTEKAKNAPPTDYGERRVRLTEDGELTESFVDNLDDYGSEKRKNS